MSNNSKILEKTAQIQQLLDEINALAVLDEFKTPTPTLPPEGARPVNINKKEEPKTDYPPVEKMAPMKSELNVDWEKVDFLKLGMQIKPKGYLDGDLWGNINKTLFAEGYRWSKEERAWVFHPEEAGKSQPQKAAGAKDKTPKVTRISDLNIDLKSPTIEGQLLDDPVQRDVDTKRGPATVTSFRIDDGSGICRVSLWGDLAEAAMDLTSGAKIRITSLMVREPYDGMPQVSTGKWSKVTQV